MAIALVAASCGTPQADETVVHVGSHETPHAEIRDAADPTYADWDALAAMPAARPVRHRAARSATRPRTSAPPADVDVHAGGELPPNWVLWRESKGDPRVWNGGCYAPVGWPLRSPCGTSSASGKWQITRGTWTGYGGYLNAADAPADVQDAKARLLWAGGAGCSHWEACA